jgi:UDP-GlcNAc:undecaprenyl-phosphate GlcNAc-1-phosphate transferase
MSLMSVIIVTFIASLLAIKLFKPVAIEVGLVDKPNERKLHSGNIPLIGGIAIFLAVLFTSFFFLPNTIELRMYLIASAMMVFIGALDDKFDLRVRVRIVGQIIVASLMIYGIGSYIENLGNIFGFGDVHLGTLGVFFTYFCIIVAINAFNMVDGIDGLIGALSLNTFTALAILFILSGQTHYVSYPLIIVAAIIPYLIYNLGLFQQQTKKIFMGDAGSMFIGLSVIWLLTLGSQGENAAFRPVTALWICAIPLMDMLSIVVRRVQNGRSPFKPDRDHLHHILQRNGLTTKKTLVVITIISVFFSLMGIVGEILKINETLMLLLFFFYFVVYFFKTKQISLKH